MILYSFALVSTFSIGASASCVPDKYCQQQVGPLSYCRTWTTPSTCQGSSTVSKCDVCGGKISLPTTTTTPAPRTTTKSSTSSSSTTSIKGSSTTTRTTTTSMKSVTTTLSPRNTTNTTTTTTITATTRVATTLRPSTPIYSSALVSTFSIGASAPCVPDKYCQQQVGPLSYCRTWTTPSTCQGSSTVSKCDVCGGKISLPTTTTTPAPRTTTKSSTSSSSTTSIKGSSTTTRTTTTSMKSVTTTLSPRNTTNTTTTTTITATTRVSTTSTPPTPIDGLCESTPTSTVPMFVWVECPPMYTNADFASFYAKLLSFVQGNCAGIIATTIVIRVPHPYFPNSFAEPVYSPPASSPIYTEFISKVTTSSGKVKILLYPYVMDAFSRGQWIKFGTSTKAKPVTGTMTTWDGIFSYVSQWQSLVGTNGPVVIDGFMVDFEEIRYSTEPQNAVTMSQAELQPYRAAYPTIKIGTSVGYDDKSRINLFAPYLDYLHLQMYDFYYPTAGADSTPSSIFTTYKNDASQLASVIMKNVITPNLIDLYRQFSSKVWLMWSTQSMNTDCIYPMGYGACGINNEFNWNPVPFNAFVQAIMASDPVLGSLPHGVYTFNFIRPQWLTIPSRSR